MVVALGLAGCTPVASGGEPTRAATNRPTGTLTPTPVRTVAPTCAQLASTDDVRALVGGTGEPQRFEHLPSGSVTPAWNVLAANGAVCGWGVEGLHEMSGSIGSPSVFLQLAPGLEAAWTSLAAEQSPSAGSPYDGGVSSGGKCIDGFCTTNVLVGGAWLEVQATVGQAHLDEVAFHGFVQDIVTRYRALPAPTTVTPHAVRPCDDSEVKSAVEERFGGTVEVRPYTASFNLDSALRQAGYRTSCMYSMGGYHGTEVDVTLLDGVDPALFHTYRSAFDHADSRPVDASSLPGEATALFEPTEDSFRTIVDVLDQGRWLDILTYETRDSAAVVQLAGALLSTSWVD